MIALVYLLSILLPGICSIPRGLISDFIGRESVNSIFLFQCNRSEQFELSKYLSSRFSLPFQNFEVNSNRFYFHHHRVMSLQHHRFGLVVDLDCPLAEKFLDFCSCRSYFNSSYRWLLVGHKSMNESSELLETLNLNIDTRIVLMTPGSEHLKGNQRKIYEVYNTIHRRGGKLQVVEVATVQSDSEIIWTGSTNSYQQRKNLQGIKLRAGATTLGENNHTSAKEYLRQLFPARKYSMDRFGYQISLLLSEHHNFKVHLILAKGWGLEVTGTNSSRGVMGQLQQNLVDYAMMLISIRTERLGSFDYTVPTTTLKVMTVFRRPKIGNARNVFLLPFDYSVWGAILVIIFMAIILFSTSFCMERKTLLFFRCRMWLKTAGFLFQQPCSGTPKTVSSSVTICAVILFSLIIYQFYSAFIIGSLLVLPPRSIRSSEDLLTSRLQYSVDDIPYNREFFNRTTDSTALKLYNRKIRPNKYGFVDAVTGVKLLKQGTHAFHCDITYLYTWVTEMLDQQQICELDEIYLFPIRPSHLPVPKGSPLKKLFKVTLRRLQETGLAGYYRNRLFSKKPHCMKSSFAYARVGFDDVASLLWILALGMVSGLVVMVVEIVEFRVRAYLEMRDFLRGYRRWVN